MARQSGPRIITLRADLAGGDALIVAVEDTGPSIEASDLPQLFEPFFTTKQDGLGMGLAICQTKVEARGGRLTVQSAPGAVPHSASKCLLSRGRPSNDATDRQGACRGQTGAQSARHHRRR
ncbi:ATP-binding protein [Bradyrhizobium symbiodeficiens]|uniref:ATP-binding protein n=1 Tax=Bradyrhizobium symbiodeficiens TaxID=1404367 RepID=UPI0030D2E7F6